MDDVAVILAAAGTGTRLGRDEPKAFVDLDGRSLLELALDGVRAAGLARIVVAVPNDAVERARSLAGDATVVAGGSTRQRSVAAALDALVERPPAVVVCHDAARPFATAAMFERVVAALDRWDGAVAAVPVTDTIKRVDHGVVVATEPRAHLVAAQTPQAFRWNALWDAHRRADADGVEVTDDAACLERAGYAVGVVDGEPGNFKITTEDDLRRAASILAMRRGWIRSGIGFDVHAFDASRPLRLGGVEITDAPGLAGHSDGDAVCHAIADAVLGAAALGDVGEHFPDTDPSVEGIPGTALLERTVALVRDAGYTVSSVDVTVIAERPAITPQKPQMREALAAALGLTTDAVSVKATRPEGLGLSGEGIGYLAVAVLDRR